MPIRVHIGGSICPPEEAKVSVFDRGFLYGDSVYETIGTSHGRLFAARDHLDRLERSAERIGLRAPPRAAIEKAMADTIAAAGFPESRVRVILTRGSGKLDLDPASTDDTQLVVIVFPLGAPTPEMYEKGVAVAIVSITRNSPAAMDPKVKSGNYLNNVLALGEARRRSKAYEAILCGGDGSIAEGSTSNIFVVVGRRGPDAAPRGRDPGRHHAREGHRALPRERRPLRRAAHLARRAARRRRGLHHQRHPRRPAGHDRRREAGRRRRPRARHPPADGSLRRARPPRRRLRRGDDVNPAAALLPKFFVICSVILILTGVAQYFVRPTKPNGDAAREARQPRRPSRRCSRSPSASPACSSASASSRCPTSTRYLPPIGLSRGVERGSSAARGTGVRSAEASAGGSVLPPADSKPSAAQADRIPVPRAPAEGFSGASGNDRRRTDERG